MSALLHYVEPALIVKWSFETQNSTSAAAQVSAGKRKNCSDFAITTQTQGRTFLERFRFGYLIILSSRNVGTPYWLNEPLTFLPNLPITFPRAERFSF